MAQKHNHRGSCGNSGEVHSVARRGSPGVSGSQEDVPSHPPPVCRPAGRARLTLLGYGDSNNEIKEQRSATSIQHLLPGSPSTKQGWGTGGPRPCSPIISQPQVKDRNDSVGHWAQGKILSSSFHCYSPENTSQRLLGLKSKVNLNLDGEIRGYFNKSMFPALVFYAYLRGLLANS